MLVAELIEQLLKMDENAEVSMYDPVEDVYVPVDGVKLDSENDVVIY